MTSKLRVLPYVLFLLPFDAILGFCLLLTSPLGLVMRRHKHSEPQKPQALATTIVIVSWDGKHLLAESLPAVIDAVRQDGHGHEILVVDNGSTDGSVDFIREQFPSVRILALDRNYGFGEGNNRGVQAAQTDIVILLNNDMIVDRGFLGPLLEGFSDPSIFAVSCQIFFADPERRREETGKTRGRFEHGAFYLWHDELVPGDVTCRTLPVFWAGGGSCAIDRNKFLTLGGFDALYAPFYLEDTDVSYQAWKRGWRCLFAPASRVVHKHRSTTQRKFGSDFVENTIRKNQFLFVWKNLTDTSMLIEHLIHLPRLHGREMMRQSPQFEVKAFLRAFLQLPRTLRHRINSIAHQKVSDREVLAQMHKQA